MEYGKLYKTINKLKIYKLNRNEYNDLYSLFTPDLSYCIGTTDYCSLHDLKWVANQISYFLKDDDGICYVDYVDLYKDPNLYFDSGINAMILLHKFNCLYGIKELPFSELYKTENEVIYSEIDITDLLISAIERGDSE